MKFMPTFTALAFAVGLSSVAHAQNFVEGQDYRVLPNPENIAGDVIVVREFFWYGCPHCYALEPHMQAWKKTRAKDVAFFRTPAAMNPVWEVTARGFYAAQQMGYEEKTHQALFDAIHKDKTLTSTPTKEALTEWYASKGVDKAKFAAAYDSFAVSNKIERSKAGSRNYQVTGVPAVVVHGKYVVTGEDAKVTQVIDFLINKVREEKK